MKNKLKEVMFEFETWVERQPAVSSHDPAGLNLSSGSGGVLYGVYRYI
jgi:hypothetical protein